MTPIELAFKTRDKQLKQLRVRYLVIKAIMYAALSSVGLTVILLAGCGHVTSDREDAMQACYGIIDPGYRDICMANYVNTARAGRDAQWSAIGMGMLARPRATSCMNIGGIVTCR